MDEFDSWLLAHLKNLNFNLVEYSWPLDWWPELYDFSCTIDLEESFVGRGSDFNQNIAIRKAVVEALERRIGRFNDLSSSNGVAAHTNLHLATFASQAELLERDAFLCHFLLRRPFAKFDGTHKAISSRVFSKLDESCVNVSAYKLLNTKNHKGILVVASGIGCKIPWGVCFGTAVAESYEEAYLKAFTECLRHIVPLVQSDTPRFLSVTEFMNLNTYSVDEHFRLGLHPDYGEWFFKTFLNSSIIDLPEQGESKITQRELSLPTEFNNSGIYAVVSQSDVLQNLYFGQTFASEINIKRLEEFRRNVGGEEELNLTPHPFC